MSGQKPNRKIVVVNQAVNYLTIGLCNAFAEKFEKVELITGSIHEQGEELKKTVGVTKINRWAERPAFKKLISYLWACIQIYALLLTRYRKYEVFFISLPPMAYLMTIALPNRCSMLIWDVYPDVFKITGMNESHPMYKIWSKLNRIVFKRAYKLFTIGGKMADLLSNYVGRDKILITPIWSIFQSNEKIQKTDNPFVLQENLQGKFVVQYSGNIGLTHNVEVMVELAELMREHEGVLFQIIGRGPRVPYLKALVEEKNLPNCQFLPFQSDEMFPYSLSAADVGAVILDGTTSKGSVPSKSYNLMSYGIPGLYVASEDSELHDYAKRYRHAKCVDNSNLDEAVTFILRLKDNETLRKEYSRNALKASQNYRRSNADEIVAAYLEKPEQC
jgi:glycosyltransferase involved in cell wall biosynthesis